MRIITIRAKLLASGKARAKIGAMEGQENPPSWRYTGTSPEAGLSHEDDIRGSTSGANAHHASSITWIASEYIAQEKNAAWYVLYGIVATILVLLTQLVGKNIYSTIVVFILCVGVAVYGSRKPQQQQYTVDDKGVVFAGKRFSYGEFRSFAIVQDGAVPSVWLIPLQRLRPPLTMYFSPDDGDKILDLISDYLPHEQRDYDLLERLMRYLHF